MVLPDTGITDRAIIKRFDQLPGPHTLPDVHKAGLVRISNMSGRVAARQALAMDAPSDVGAVDAGAQDPTGANLLDRDIGLEFPSDLVGPALGSAAALEQFFALIHDGGIEYGCCEYGHVRCS